jgi:hypothetical protein
MIPLSAKVFLPAKNPIARVNATITYMILVIERYLKERILLLPHAYVPAIVFNGPTMAMVQRNEWGAANDAA